MVTIGLGSAVGVLMLALHYAISYSCDRDLSNLSSGAPKARFGIATVGSSDRFLVCQPGRSRLEAETQIYLVHRVVLFVAGLHGTRS